MGGPECYGTEYNEIKAPYHRGGGPVVVLYGENALAMSSPVWRESPSDQMGCFRLAGGGLGGEEVKVCSSAARPLLCLVAKRVLTGSLLSAINLYRTTTFNTLEVIDLILLD